MKRSLNVSKLTEYQNKRIINRPPTTIKTALAKMIFFVISVTVISLIIRFLTRNLNIGFCGILIVTLFLSVLVFAKRILILSIELYQHYASDEVRRRCVCKPSCSDYAIMALNKYNTFKAIYLIYSRLERCYGSELIIDYP